MQADNQPNVVPINKHELIELFLTNNLGTKQESFQTKFQTLLDRTPRIHSSLKPEFFPYFFLGSVLTLPHTELMAKLGIKDIYVKTTDRKGKLNNQTIKLIFNIENSQGKQLVFKTITTVKKVEYYQHLSNDELEEIAGELGLTAQNMGNYEVKGEIVHIKDGNLKIEKLKVAEEQNLKNLRELNEAFKGVVKTSDTLLKVDERRAQFKKVEKVKEIDNFKDVVNTFASGNPEIVKTGAEGTFKSFVGIFRSTEAKMKDDVRKLKLADSEAAYHGFAYGALALNFKYRYALDINVERIAGRGYSDLMLISRLDEGKNKNWDAVPIVVEFKKGKKETAQNAVKQIKDRGYIKNLPSMRTVAEKGVMIGVNFDLDQNNGGVLAELSGEISKHESFAEILKKVDIKRAIEKESIAVENLKEALKTKLNYLYYLIVDSNGGGRNTNYLSRLILGELLADSKLKKHVFIDSNSMYDETNISTFVLKMQDDKFVILNVIEEKGFEIDKVIPLSKLGIDPNKCIQIDIKVSPNAEVKDGFEAEGGKGYYQDIKTSIIDSNYIKYKGEFKEIGNVDILQGNEFQAESLKSALFPLKELITAENEFQAVLQGLLVAQEFDKGSNEFKRVFTESNYSGVGKADLIVSRIEKNNDRYKEDELIVMELKYAEDQASTKRKST